ncbi:MAG: sigma 54-interacting transcriptional regulator [Proteobacteria bacterium]|nr:sigma 54-interacting transcriptional regulator [Pseudomonadota bacterium]
MTEAGAADLHPSRPIGRRRGDRIVGSSSATQETLEQASSVARGDAPVLITGPPGAGKAHVARAIHSWSSQASGPAVTFSVSGTRELVQSRELFGASASAEPLLSGGHDGALAHAEGGSLILLGIDRLAASVRETLLQSLKAGRYRREGVSESAPVKARVIATARTGDASLFGDLGASTVTVAALADRPEDILPLAVHFLAEAAGEEDLEPVGFTADARRCLVEETWAGNVRELRERVRQAVKLAGDGAISVEALVLAIDGEDVPSFKEAKRGFETRYVEGLLRRCNGNISRAARLAKKDRKDFYDVIRRTGVDPGEFRP